MLQSSHNRPDANPRYMGPLRTRQLLEEQQFVVLGIYLTNTWIGISGNGAEVSIQSEPSVKLVWSILSYLYPNLRIHPSSLYRWLANWRKANPLMWALAHSGTGTGVRQWMPTLPGEVTNTVVQTLPLRTRYSMRTRYSSAAARPRKPQMAPTISSLGVVYRGRYYVPSAGTVESYLRWIQAAARGDKISLEFVQKDAQPPAVFGSMDGQVIEDFVLRGTLEMSMATHEKLCNQVLRHLSNDVQRLQDCFAQTWNAQFKTSPRLDTLTGQCRPPDSSGAGDTGIATFSVLG